MKPLRISLILAALTLGSCSKNEKIDGSSDEAMKASIEEARGDLSPQEREKFESAMMVLALNGQNLFEMAADSDGASRRIRDVLDGKTVSEVIEEADKVRLQREIEETRQSVVEFAELEKKRDEAEKAKESLKAFEVKRSRFYFDKAAFSGGPTIELTVSNGMAEAVSRAYFQGVLATPGRAIPWVVDDFNYSISGGLEPGEEATWKLSPNMFGEWSKAPKDRTDMVFTVTVTGLDGADGEPILEADFSEADKERLEELRKNSKQRGTH